MSTYAKSKRQNRRQLFSNIHKPSSALADKRHATAIQKKHQINAYQAPQLQKIIQLQALADHYASDRESPIQQQAIQKNSGTGLPDTLKTSIEQLSGFSMDDVSVHRNSDKPAQLQARAYAQGNDIHLAPGQEQHLPHEAWHVVQQKQGRVRATTQMKSSMSIKANVNDDGSLEKEADVMGAKAAALSHTVGTSSPETAVQLHQGQISSSSAAQCFTDEEMESFRERRAKEQEEELEGIASLQKVSRFFGGTWTEKHWETDVITVGVTFRTDGRGSAHTGHDMTAVDAMNELGLPFRVVGVALPRGAGGEVSPERVAESGELDGIDMLYIPGGPTANDTQTGATQEDADFMRLIPPAPVANPGEFTQIKPEKPPAPVFDPSDREGSQVRIRAYQRSPEYLDYKERNDLFVAAQEQHQQQSVAYRDYQSELTKYHRKNKEHSERASYELALIDMARTRGIPIMAVCAGSWRLLESYGGEVHTLPESERSVHRATGDVGVWDISHDIDVDTSSTMSSMMKVGPKMGAANSTHWAVASEDSPGKLTRRAGAEDPNAMLAVSARTGGETTKTLLEAQDDTPSITLTSPNEPTVEAFESKYGAPNIGAQWHPESYLPGMLGEHDGSAEIQKGSKNLFTALGKAAATSRTRASGIVPSLNKEGGVFKILVQSAEGYLEGKQDFAEHLLDQALSILPEAEWSANMLELVALIEEIKSFQKMDQSSVSAGNIYIGLKSKLGQYTNKLL